MHQLDMGFAGAAGKRPGRRLTEVGALRAVMCRNRSHISDVLHESPGRIVIGKHPITVTFGQLRNIRIHLPQRFVRNLLNLIANRCIASHDIEIVAVEPEAVPDELGQSPT